MFFFISLPTWWVYVYKKKLIALIIINSILLHDLLIRFLHEYLSHILFYYYLPTTSGRHENLHLVLLLLYRVHNRYLQILYHVKGCKEHHSYLHIVSLVPMSNSVMDEIL